MLNINLDLVKEAKNSKDYAYKVIRENILNLNLCPGLLISENSLTDALGMSRTPVREAILKLSKEHMIDIYPQRGTYVSKIDMKRVKEAIFARLTLESSVIKLACRNFTNNDYYALESNLNQQEFAQSNNQLGHVLKLDNSMHEYLFLGNGMDNIWNLLTDINADYYRLRYINLTSEVRLLETVKEHRKIIDAIKDKNEELASRLLEKHIQLLYEDVKVINSEYPDYFI